MESAVLPLEQGPPSCEGRGVAAKSSALEPVKEPSPAPSQQGRSPGDVVQFGAFNRGLAIGLRTDTNRLPSRPIDLRVDPIALLARPITLSLEHQTFHGGASDGIPMLADSRSALSLGATSEPLGWPPGEVLADSNWTNPRS